MDTPTPRRSQANLGTFDAGHLFQLDPDAYIVCDAIGGMLLVSGPARKLAGEIRATAEDLLPPDNTEILAYCLGQNKIKPIEHETHGVILILRYSPVPQEGKVIIRLRDATEEVQVQRREAYLKTHDELTGLMNRRQFAEQTTEWLSNLAAFPFALLLIDLNQLKRINDTYGHPIGDQILHAVALQFKEALREDIDVLARVGGDEFAILLKGVTTEDEVKAVCRRIKEIMATPITVKPAAPIGGKEFPYYASCSIGVTFASEANPATYAQLYREADAAMYKAKEEYPSGGYRIFDQDMHDRIARNLRLETDLQSALERGELSHAFQPIVRHSARGVQVRSCFAGAEILLRWNHPELGSIPADEFVSIAERTLLIIPIGEWTLREACKTLKRWEEFHPTHPRRYLTVNVAPQQLLQDEAGFQPFIALIANLLEEYNLEAKLLKLEITEESFRGNKDRLLKVIHGLSKMGIQVCIDDFGTGWSNFILLKQFPTGTAVKIDGSLVKDITSVAGQAELAVLEAITTMCEKLGLPSVVEGVETHDQVVSLRTLGVEYIQGFHYSRPVPEPECWALMEQGLPATL